MHRWVWDLHYPSPDSARHEYPISAIPGDTPRLPLGPTALPGHYTARLTVDGKSYTAPLHGEDGPSRKNLVGRPGEKFQLETRLASLLTETSKAVLQAGSIRDPLQKLSQQATGAAHDSVQAFQNKLVAVLGRQPVSFHPSANEITLSSE